MGAVCTTFFLLKNNGSASWRHYSRPHSEHAEQKMYNLARCSFSYIFWQVHCTFYLFHNCIFSTGPECSACARFGVIHLSFKKRYASYTLAIRVCRIESAVFLFLTSTEEDESKYILEKNISRSTVFYQVQCIIKSGSAPTKGSEMTGSNCTFRRARSMVVCSS